MKLVTQQGHAYPLRKERISIGRASSNDIRLADELASGHHAMLRREGPTYVLTDQNSTNGTYVNRQRLRGAHRLQPGDVIGVGRTLLKVSADAPVNRTVVAGDDDLPAPGIGRVAGPQVGPQVGPRVGPYQQQPGGPYQQPPYAARPQKDRMTAGLLALFLGNIGVHKFYLNQGGMGVLYLLFSWTFIPGLIALVEGIQYLTMSDQDFHQRYG